MKGTIFHVPVEQAATPINGDALCDNWWSAHPEKGLAFYFVPLGYYQSEEPSPQCNSVEATARHLTKQLYPDHDVRQMPVVFMGHAMREMGRIRKRLTEERAAARLAARDTQSPQDETQAPKAKPVQEPSP